MIFLIAFALYSAKVLSYTWVIYTDEEGGAFAKEFVDKVKTTNPFDKFEIQYEIKEVEPEILDCGSHTEIERVISCDTTFVRRDLIEENGDQALIIKDSTSYQGSGGSIPMVTTATSPEVLIHEYMHTVGFGDEYRYGEEESQYYCRRSSDYVNLARIKPRSRDYKSDQYARKKHRKRIPWYHLILPETKITHQDEARLGTGKVDNLFVSAIKRVFLRSSKPIGLYPAITCENSTNTKYKWWQASGAVTIMRDSEAPIGDVNEAILFEILKSRGIPLRNVEEEVEGQDLADRSALENDIVDSTEGSETSAVDE